MRKRPLWAFSAAVLTTSTMSLAQPAAEEPFQELPLSTWQQELELQSTVRQVLLNMYLPFLARPTDFRGVHNDAIPNQVIDWNWHRPEVRDQLRGRQNDVDAKRRSHAAIPDAEVNALIGKKQAFRPEELERVLTGSPRLDDIIVVIRRAQPLGPIEGGGEVVRVDFDVKTIAGGVSESTSFDRIDLIHNAGTWLLPTRLILEVAPIARAGAVAASGSADPLALARSAISVVLNTVRDISPIALPRLPIIEE